jgi:pimeloyl-ACP methyl ester carboxylesterase
MMEVANTPALELRYRAAGSGRPLVLLHAFPVDGRLFDAQLSAADAGRVGARLIAVDLPGFGASPLPDPAPDVLTVEEIADALAAFIEGEGLAGAVVGGVAIGGYSALELAARRPDLVAGLVLMACKASADPPENAPKREEVARLALDQGAATVADELHAQPLGPQADGAVRARMHEMISAADPRAIAALVRGIARRPDPSSALAGANVPALVFAGERDPFARLEDVRNAARLLPDADFVIIQGVGHMAPLEAPLAVSRALAAFVERVGGN